MQSSDAQHLPAEIQNHQLSTSRNCDRLLVSRKERRDVRALLSLEFWKWYVAPFGWLPGRAGPILRGFAYRPFLTRAGRPIFSSEQVRITSPNKLQIGDCGAARHYSFLNAAGGIKIGNWAAVTHRSTLNTVNHVYEDPDIPVRIKEIGVAPIVTDDDAWPGSGLYVMPGVTIGKGAIAAANSIVTRAVPAHTIVAGMPTKPVRRGRLMGEEKASSEGDQEED